MRKLTLISGLMLVAFAAAASAAEKQVKPGKPVKSRRSRGENMQAARKTNRKPVAVERLVRGSQPLFRSERYVAYEERAGSGGRGRVSVSKRGDASPAAQARVGRERPVYETRDGRWIVPSDQILFRPLPGKAPADWVAELESLGLVAVTPMPRLPGVYAVPCTKGTDPFALAASVGDLNAIEWAQVDCHREKRKRDLPNDPLFPDQAALRNTGQSGGMTHRDLAAEQAWQITTGRSDVVIAVLDDGFDMAHPDLAGQAFINTNDPTNSIDDDLNGYIDDWRGWDFFAGDNDPSPVVGGEDGDNHGTCVVGPVIAAANNGEGIAGLAHGCRYLPVRFTQEGASAPLDSQVAEAVNYAASFADVISISYLMGPTPLTTEAFRDAVTLGRDGKGCVLCVAFGNEGVRRRYTMDLAAAAEVMGVGGNSNLDRRSFFADFGSPLTLTGPAGGGSHSLVSTDRPAPDGYNTNGSYYTSWGGTSASAPIVAAAAALLISQYPDWTGLQVRRQLEQTADQIDYQAVTYGAAGRSEPYGAGRVNVWKALSSEPSVWDPYEPDNSFGQSHLITDGEMQYRRFQTGSDQDWVRIVLTVPADVQFTVVGTTNASLSLYSSSLTPVAGEDAGTYRTLTASSLSSGTYYLRVAATGTAEPTYGLHYALLRGYDSHEVDDEEDFAKALPARTRQVHSIYPAGDVDYMWFSLAQPASVELVTMGELLGDTVMTLYDSGGTGIATNDDYDAENHAYSLISIDLPAGEYHVKVNEWDPSLTLDSYEIMLEVYEPDAQEPDNTLAQATPIQSGDRLEYTTFPTGDIDWAVFTLTNQANVLITTDAQDPAVPDLGDDTVLYLYDSDLSLISFNDDGNAFYFSAIYETGLVAGTYYIAVEGFDLYTTTNRWYTLTYDAYPAQTVITNFAVAGSNRFEIGWPGDSVFTYDILTRSNAWAEWVFKTNVPGSIGANAVEFQDDDDQKWYRVRTK